LAKQESDMRWQEIAEGAAGPLMSMQGTLGVLNRLVADGVINTYAIAGAVAAYTYIEPTVTDDLDIIVSLDTTGSSGLVVLTPILTALATMGYTQFRNEGIVVEGWTVQFLPVAKPLDAEALQSAEVVNITLGGQDFPTRVLRPEYLVAKALDVGRAKDNARIVQFIEEKAVDLAVLQDVLNRFGLVKAWERFCQRMGIDQNGKS
jgi:hypothetical protein